MGCQGKKRELGPMKMHSVWAHGFALGLFTCTSPPEVQVSICFLSLRTCSHCLLISERAYYGRDVKWEAGVMNIQSGRRHQQHFSLLPFPPEFYDWGGWEKGTTMIWKFWVRTQRRYS